ncbi:MAG: tetratricopeptide repeat protein [Pseudomonas sp.]
MPLKQVMVALAGLLACAAAYSATLTPTQQSAKELGITLYNQHKAISAEPYLKKAAEAGDRESQYFLGEALRLNNRYMTPEAQKWYMAAAEQGDYYAMFRLSDTGTDLCAAMNNCPSGSRSDEDWTRLLWKTAEPLAEKGDGEAMMIMYNSTGDLTWLERSASAGYAKAQWLLASRYREGEGFFFPPWKRSERVEELMKKSAEGGFVNGMGEYMGILQEKGDMAAARTLLIKIAETGDTGAIGSYGAYLAHTPNTLDYPLDLVKGYGLIYLLLELDGGGTSKNFADSILPEIAAKMTPEQIEQAKVFAKEWKATHPPLSYFPEKLGF